MSPGAPTIKLPVGYGMLVVKKRWMTVGEPCMGLGPQTVHRAYQSRTLSLSNKRLLRREWGTAVSHVGLYTAQYNHNNALLFHSGRRDCTYLGYPVALFVIFLGIMVLLNDYNVLVIIRQRFHLLS